MVFPLTAVREDGCHPIGHVIETPKSLQAPSSASSQQSSNKEGETDSMQRELHIAHKRRSFFGNHILNISGGRENSANPNPSVTMLLIKRKAALHVTS